MPAKFWTSDHPHWVCLEDPEPRTLYDHESLIRHSNFSGHPINDATVVDANSRSVGSANRAVVTPSHSSEDSY